MEKSVGVADAMAAVRAGVVSARESLLLKECDPLRRLIRRQDRKIDELLLRMRQLRRLRGCDVE